MSSPAGFVLVLYWYDSIGWVGSFFTLSTASSHSRKDRAAGRLGSQIGHGAHDLPALSTCILAPKVTDLVRLRGKGKFRSLLLPPLMQSPRQYEGVGTSGLQAYGGTEGQAAASINVNNHQDEKSLKLQQSSAAQRPSAFTPFSLGQRGVMDQHGVASFGHVPAANTLRNAQESFR